MSAPTFQEMIFRLKHYWSDRGCIVTEPYDMELGPCAGILVREPISLSTSARRGGLTD